MSKLQKRKLIKFAMTDLAGIDKTKTKNGKHFTPSFGDGRTLLMKSAFEDVKTIDGRTSFHEIYGSDVVDKGNYNPETTKQNPYLDYTDESGLQDAIWNMDLSKMNYNMNHEKDSTVDFRIVEKFIERSSDNIYDVKPGTAILGIQHGKSKAGDYSLGLAKDGNFGLSFEGTVIESKIESDDLELTKAADQTMTITEYLKNQLSKFTNTKNNNGDTEMTKDEINEIISKRFESEDFKNLLKDKTKDKSEDKSEDKTEDKSDEKNLTKSAHINGEELLSRDEVLEMISDALKSAREENDEDKEESLTKAAVAELIDKRISKKLIKSAQDQNTVEPNPYGNGYGSIL